MSEEDLTQMPESQAAPEEPVDFGADADIVLEPAAEDAIGAKPGFFKTTLGRVLLIGCAISTLLGVMAVVGFLVITFFFVDAVDEATQDLQNQVNQAGQSQTTTGTVGQDTSEDPQPGSGDEYAHSDVRLTGVHVWRDIFQPLLTPISEEETDTGTTDPDTTPTDGSGQYQADTLYLLDILTGTSETAAQFYYNGIDHNTTTEFASTDHVVVKEGERLENTPWRLLSIGVTTVTLQYGDSTVTLSVGQGIKK